jgi:TolA-binding protein
MNKHIGALGAAVAMTICTGTAIVAIGGVAMLNEAGVAASDSPVSTSSNAANVSVSSPAATNQLQDQIAQYQTRVQEYQSREQQYQEALNRAQAQLAADAQQTQQIQLLLMALQQRGLISLGSDGSIFIRGGDN